MKKNNIFYWITTGLLALGFFASSIMYLTRNPELVNSFNKLGFPIFFVTILGVAKLLGAVALVNPWWDKLKEWAYAGFTFVLIGAISTHIATGTSFIAPLFFLVLAAASYYFRQQLKSRVHKLVLS